MLQTFKVFFICGATQCGVKNSTHNPCICSRGIKAQAKLLEKIYNKLEEEVDWGLIDNIDLKTV